MSSHTRTCELPAAGAFTRHHSTNNFASGSNPNKGNFLTERPTITSLCAAGGNSTICLGTDISNECVKPDHCGQARTKYEIESRVLPDRSEAETSLGLESRDLEYRHVARPAGGEVEAGHDIGHRVLPDRHIARPLGGEAEAGYGIGKRILDDQHASRPNGGEVEAGYGIGNRVLPDRHVARPLGGEVEAGYGIGNRILDDQHASRPVGGEVEAGYGIGNRVLPDRHVTRPLGGEVEAGYGIGNRILDDQHASRPVGGEVEAGYGIGNRVLPDRHVARPLGGEEEAGYGIGNRVLCDRHVACPLGGEVEAGYGIGNRVLENRHVKRLPPRALPTSKIDEAELALRNKINTKFSDMRTAFRALDRNNNGCLSRKEFVHALAYNFLPSGYSLEDLEALASRVDFNSDGFISFDEFSACIEGKDCEIAVVEKNKESSTQVLDVDVTIQALKQSLDSRFNSLQKAFRSLSKDRKAWLTPADLCEAFRSLDVRLAPAQLDEVLLCFDPARTMKISYSDFCFVMSKRSQFESHLNRQAINTWQLNLAASLAEDSENDPSAHNRMASLTESKPLQKIRIQKEPSCRPHGAITAG